MALLATKGLQSVIPQEHRDSVQHCDSVRYSDHPPDASWVGYFPWRGDPIVWAGENDAAVNAPDEAPWGKTYSAALAFGGIGFLFVGFPDPMPADYVIGSGSYPIRQFWPIQPGLIHWPPQEPPAEATDLKDIVRFAPLVPKG